MELVNVTIRSEQPGDYHAIAAVNAIAFSYGYGMGEVSLVSALRNRMTFDPELSIIAEHNGNIIGHALFTPQKVLVKGETLDAVILGPIAVRPKFQKLGIGSMLIEEGHKRSTHKGYHFSLLLGHSTYYPRFGYKTKMFGSSHIQIHVTIYPN
ncbi:GNAT family N-acetyltransferase [Paenibacillus sp. NPDC056579]|uniref:GNAT family N-acetyltransferase n=1 Tax=Paenibacillus sp. NPDC056579 TaxID=3345871 RepID=UPI0036AF97B5